MLFAPLAKDMDARPPGNTRPPENRESRQLLELVDTAEDHGNLNQVLAMCEKFFYRREGGEVDMASFIRKLQDLTIPDLPTNATGKKSRKRKKNEVSIPKTPCDGKNAVVKNAVISPANKPQAINALRMPQTSSPHKASSAKRTKVCEPSGASSDELLAGPRRLSCAQLRIVMLRNAKRDAKSKRQSRE
jgi:hypothetical protein